MPSDRDRIFVRGKTSLDGSDQTHNLVLNFAYQPRISEIVPGWIVH